MTATTTASDVALALAKSRLPRWWDDRDDRIHDFLVHVLEKMATSYDPARGEVSSYVYEQFRWWYAKAVGERIARRDNEILTPDNPEDDAATPLADRHRLTGEAGRLLSLLPAAGRPLVETHLAYGASLTATAELHGVSDRTVSRWVATARQIWTESA